MPRRRRGLIHHAFPDETLVYDLASDRAHRLDAAASLVFSLCDGDATAVEMAGVVAGKLAVEDAVGLVERALDQLAKARLVDGWSRPRRRPGERGKTLPLVSAMPAPAAATAALYAAPRRRKA